MERLLLRGRIEASSFLFDRSKKIKVRSARLLCRSPLQPPLQPRQSPFLPLLQANFRLVFSAVLASSSSRAGGDTEQEISSPPLLPVGPATSLISSSPLLPIGPTAALISSSPLLPIGPATSLICSRLLCFRFALILTQKVLEAISVCSEDFVLKLLYISTFEVQLFKPSRLQDLNFVGVAITSLKTCFEDMIQDVLAEILLITTSRKMAVDLSPYQQDIDELIRDFGEGDYKLLSDMKRVWLARKFSYIFDAVPGNSNMALVMQALYAQCIGHMVATYSLSHRLGGLYCLYCLYEIQPFNPQFKVYMSIGVLRRLRSLLVDAKKDGIRVVTTLIRRMLQRDVFLFGFVDMNDYSEAEELKISKHKAMLQRMHEKLFTDSSIEQYLHVDMGKELGLDKLQNLATEYAEAKTLALKEASELVDVEDIKHLAENTASIGDEVKKIVENWNREENVLHEQPGSKRMQRPSPMNVDPQGDEGYWDAENLPEKGFMHMLTAGGEIEEDMSQDIQVEEIERLLECEDYQEEQQSSYAEDLEKMLSNF